MSANPIDEAVVQLRRMADVIRKHGTVPSLSLEHIANTLTAAQQQGQSVACTCPSGDGSLRWPCPSHQPDQPKQQGQAVAWLAADGSGRVIDHKAKAAGGRALATGSATSIYSIPLYTAPPSAPVGVGAKHIEALRSLRNVGVLYVEEREAIDAIIADLAQQPAPSAPVGVEAVVLEAVAEWEECKSPLAAQQAMFKIANDLRANEADRTLAQRPAAVDGVDWRAMYRFQTAMRYMDNNPQITKERAYTMADEDCAALATQHQEPTT